MPTVPTYSQQGTTNPLPGGSSRGGGGGVPSFGSISGQPFLQLANHLAVAQKRDEEYKTRKAETDFAQGIQTLFHGEDGTGGINALSGQDFIDSREQFLADLDKLQEETLAVKGVNREALEVAVAQQRLRTQETFFTSIGKAQREMEKQLSADRKNLIIQEARAHPHNVLDLIDKMDEENTFMLKDAGIDLGSESAEVALRQERSRVVQVAVEEAVEQGDFVLAGNILTMTNEHSDKPIDGALHDQLGDNYRKAFATQQGIDIFKNAFATHPNNRQAQYDLINRETRNSIDAAVAGGVATDLFKERAAIERGIASEARANLQNHIAIDKLNKERAATESIGKMLTAIASEEVLNAEDLVNAFGQEYIQLPYAQKNHLSGFIKQLRDPPKEMTPEGVMMSIEAMNNPDSVTAEKVPQYLDNIPATRVVSMFEDKIDVEDKQAKQNYSNLFKSLESTLMSNGLGDAKYSSLRENIMVDVRRAWQASTDKSNPETVNKILDIYDRETLAKKESEYRNTLPSNVSVIDFVKGDLAIREFEEESKEDRALAEQMIKETIDIQSGGKPNYYKMSQASSAIMDEQWEEPGFLGIGTRRVSLYEVYKDMSEEEISAATEQLRLGGYPVTRALIAEYHALNNPTMRYVGE